MELNFEVGGGHGVYDDAYHVDRISGFISRLLCGHCDQLLVRDQTVIRMEQGMP